MAKKVGWQLDMMPDKMKAMATFHGELLKTLESNPQVNKTISSAGARIVSKYFDAYLDHIAKIDSYRYHHIYEFGMTGSSSGRLFKSSIRNGVISYSFIDASKPNNNGYMFSKKAFVMEAGSPLEITPKNSKYLVYDLNGELVFSSKSVVMNPGGKYVAGAFQQIFEEFFNSTLPNKALKEFGFYDTIEQAIGKESSSAAKAINAGDINNAAGKAARAAYGIAGKVEDNGNRL